MYALNAGIIFAKGGGFLILDSIYHSFSEIPYGFTYFSAQLSYIREILATPPRYI